MPKDDCEGKDCVVIQYKVITVTLEAEVDPISGTRRPIALFGEPLRTVYQKAFETGVANTFIDSPSPDGPQCEGRCTCVASEDPADVLTSWTKPKEWKFEQGFTRSSTGLKVLLVGQVERQMRKVKGLCGGDRTGDDIQGVPEGIDFGNPVAGSESVTISTGKEKKA